MAKKKYLDDNGLSYFWSKLKTKLAEKQDTLVSGTNIKTINNQTVLGSGNIDINNVFHAYTSGEDKTSYAELCQAIDDKKIIIVDGSWVPVHQHYNNNFGYLLNCWLDDGDPMYTEFQVTATDSTWSYVDTFLQPYLQSGTNIKTINNTSLLGSGDIEVPIVAEYGVTTYSELLAAIQATNGAIIVTNIPYNNEVIDVLVNWYSTANNTIEMESIATASGDLCDVDIQVTSASAWSVTFTSRDPFMLLDFNQSVNVTIPVCTKNVANTQIPNVDISISDELGVNWAIASLAKYEVKDSSGNRVNCWPVCQFSMNGQKTLRLRMMCGGTIDKTVTSVAGAILLKHR